MSLEYKAMIYREGASPLSEPRGSTAFARRPPLSSCSRIAAVLTEDYEMKGIILAGGKGTRLSLLTKVTNKHLLPVGKEPMIFNPIKQLVSAGVEEILVVTSTEHMGDIVNLLGSGGQFGVDFTYKVQENAGGIAHALRLGENFANREKIVVVLGDNIAVRSIKPYVDRFREQDRGARVLLKEVSEPARYGIAALDEQKIVEIEEKPGSPKTNFAVIGYYMYDEKVFDFIRQQRISERGEFEITDVNNEYIKRREMEYDILEGDWTDAGTFESLQIANRMLLECNNEINE
jgi:glucose-1-phosphate thymidylyltransferase